MTRERNAQMALGTDAEASDLLRLYGTTEAPQRPRHLSAGALSCLFDGGAVRCLSWRGTELIRSIAYLLRDTNWGTAPASVRKLQIAQLSDRFELHFELLLTLPEGELTVAAAVKGTDEGRFSFAAEAVTPTALRSNRCGFVVLHPCDAAGAPLRVEHTDGGVEELSFPALISPGQPVLDIRSLRHSPSLGLNVNCRLEAELPMDPMGRFEMEDQRNWSDASFKTYVGSLLDPWPYELPAAQRLRQIVQVSVSDSRSTAGASAMSAVLPTPRIGPATGRHMPAIGLGVPGDPQQMTAHERAAVTALNPAWLVAEADLGKVDDDAMPARLRALRDLAAACGARVQLDVVCPAEFTPGDSAARMARACDVAGLRPDAVRPCPAPYLKSYQPRGPWPELPELERYALAFGEAFATSVIGGGMLTYFTELNRKRPPGTGLRFIGHTTCPIVHAADDLSVMETLETLPHIVRSVQALWPQLAYRLGPVTLAMGRNPYGESPAANPNRERIAMAAQDPRHQGRFAAAWLAGYACAVAPLGLEVLSFNHAQGACGPLLEPDQPGWQAGACVPAWAVQQTLAGARGAALLALDGLPSGVAGIAWEGPDAEPRVLLSNLTVQTCSIAWADTWSERDLSVPAMPTESGPPGHRRAGELHLDPFQVLLLQP